jgi:hypothetical protein
MMIAPRPGAEAGEPPGPGVGAAPSGANVSVLVPMIRSELPREIVSPFTVTAGPPGVRVTDPSMTMAEGRRAIVSLPTVRSVETTTVGSGKAGADADIGTATVESPLISQRVEGSWPGVT